MDEMIARSDPSSSPAAIADSSTINQIPVPEPSNPSGSAPARPHQPGKQANPRTRATSPRIRAAIVSKHQHGETFARIGRDLHLSASACSRINREITQNLKDHGLEPSLENMVRPEILQPRAKKGRPWRLTERDKDRLVAVSRTRCGAKMSLGELRREAGLEGVPLKAAKEGSVKIEVKEEPEE